MSTRPFGRISHMLAKRKQRRTRLVAFVHEENSRASSESYRPLCRIWGLRI